MAQHGPRMIQNDPKRPKNDPKWPKITPNGPKMTPRFTHFFRNFFLTEKAIPQTFFAFRMYASDVWKPGLAVDPLPSRYSSPSDESEESPVNGIDRIWLARWRKEQLSMLNINLIMMTRDLSVKHIINWHPSNVCNLFNWKEGEINCLLRAKSLSLEAREKEDVPTLVWQLTFPVLTYFISQQWKMRTEALVLCILISQEWSSPTPLTVA